MTGRGLDMRAMCLMTFRSFESFLCSLTVRAVQVSNFGITFFTQAMIGMLMAQGRH